MSRPADIDASRRYEVERVAAAITLAQASVDQLRLILRPGLADSVASMLRDDLDAADRRVAWLRDHLHVEEVA